MDEQQFKLALILDRLRSAHNTGNVFRLAEAIGATEIIACGYTPAPPHPKLAKTAMGTDAMVPCRHVATSLEAVHLLRREGYRQILAVECSEESRFAWDIDYEFPLALVLGNEAMGVSADTLQEVDGVVSLPMFGQKASINVGNAAAAVLYAILAKAGRTVKATPETIDPSALIPEEGEE